MHPLHKIYIPIVAILIIGLGSAGWSWLKAHDAWKDLQRQSDLQAQLAAHAKEIADIQAQQTAALQAIASKPATVQSVTKLLPIPLPGKVDVQPVNGTPTLTISGDPQKNLQAIQDMEVKCAQCQIDLTAAQSTVTDDKLVIGSLTKQRDDLMKLAIPRWTATIGVTKGQNIGYKPAAFLDYRFGQRWGLTVGAANNALFGGVSIHFGGQPKTNDIHIPVLPRP